MTQIEMVEKLRESADINYADAKDALERSNWDILDAMILLEKEGKVPTKSEITYTTRKEKDEKEAEPEFSGPNKKADGASFTELLGRLMRWIGKIISIGNVNMLRATKHGEKIVDVPVTVLVVLLIVGFWVVIPLMIVGLFFGFNYRFVGPNLERDEINSAMGKASEAAESIKDEFNKATENKSK